MNLFLNCSPKDDFNKILTVTRTARLISFPMDRDYKKSESESEHDSLFFSMAFPIIFVQAMVIPNHRLLQSNQQDRFTISAGGRNLRIMTVMSLMARPN